MNMNKNIKRIFFVLTIVTLLTTVGGVCATDDTNSTAAIDNIVSDAAETNIDSTAIEPVQTTSNNINTKIIEKEEKNLKQESTPIIINSESDFDNLFDSDGYLSGVTDGSTIKINTDISKNDKSYIINKAINLTSDNNNTIDLDTSMGYNLPDSQLHYTSFNFVAGAAGSNITNIHFHNTEIYVNNTNSIVFDGISVTVTDNTVGTEVGIMSIRDDSTNITVKNSYFNTNNNGGYSTLVFAGASYSTIDNNTIIGTGTVGNLLYLTTYNVANIAEDDIELNSYNNITNNTITGPSTASDICYGIALTGHDNIIANNIVNMAGQGITTQWAYIDPETPEIGNNSDRYKGNNYTNNTINGGALFKATNNSTIENNTFTGTVTTGANSTLTNNTITKMVTAQTGSSLYNNTIFNGVLINGEKVRLISNNISKTVNTTYDNIYMEFNHICGKIKVPTTTTNVTVKNNILCNGKTGNPSVYTNNSPCGSNCNAITCDCHSMTTNTHGTVKGAGQTIEITSENIYDYFDFDGEVFEMLRSTRNRNVGNTFVFDQSAFDEMNQAEYVNFNLLNGTYLGKNNPVLRTPLHVDMYGQTIANFTINYNKNRDIFGGTMLYFEAGMTNQYDTAVMENITINVNYDYDLPSSLFSFIIIANDMDPTHIRYDENNNPLNLEELLIKNCNITMEIPSDNINWDSYSKPILIPIEIFKTSQNIDGVSVNGKYTVFENNNITLKELEYYGNYSTIWSIYNCNNNTKILNNNMYMSGTKYLYAIENTASNNTISGNNIVVNGTHYTAGVYITGANMQNNTVENNNITLYSGYGHAGTNGLEEDSGYAVVIEDRGYGGATYDEKKGSAVYNNKILNNNITSYGNNPYSIEHFGGKNTTIAGNNITAYGYNPAGIALTGVNVTIENNTIKSYAITNVTGGTVDYFPAVSTGILLQWSKNTTVNNNIIEVENGTGITARKYTELYITNNNITTTDDYAIELNDIVDASVTDNTLIARNLKGDASVTDNNGTNNVIQNNQPAEPAKEYSLKINTIEFTQGTNTTVSASIYSGDDVAANISNGKIVFKVNGKTLKDSNGKIIYAKIVNGTATIEDYEVPSTWKEGSTIQAVYSGSAQCKKLNSEKTNITITKEETTLTITPIEQTRPGQTTTLTATLSDNTINTGKIVFKINGKSVKDENGKIIYAKVTNGTVSVDYTIPESMKVGNYTVTAVFISSDYDRFEANTTMTVAN